MERDLVTVEEFAAHARVSGNTVRNWIKAGKVPVIRPTIRTLRIPFKDAIRRLQNLATGGDVPVATAADEA
jgi:predicted site-specific integrase-resolvase